MKKIKKTVTTSVRITFSRREISVLIEALLKLPPGELSFDDKALQQNMYAELRKAIK